jgi:ribose transport system permease protein
VIVLLAINGALQSGFFRLNVGVSILIACLPLMMVAVGQTYVVLGGSIDLSLGAIVSLVNVVVVVAAARLGGGNAALAAAAVLGLATGAACGALNGALIAGFRLAPIVLTFASGIVFGGLALTVMPQAGGSLAGDLADVYANGIAGVPTPIVVTLALAGLCGTLAATRFHLHLLAVGSQRQAAYQTGLPVGRIRIASHALGGLLSACAALCVLAVSAAGDPLMGQAFTLGSVSAVVLGGTALAGGWGGAVGSMLGAVALTLINNIIFFAEINYMYQGIVQGVIVLIALAAGVFVARRPG